MNKTKKSNKTSCFPCFKSKNKVKPIVQSIEKVIDFIDDGNHSIKPNFPSSWDHSRSVESLEKELSKTAFQITFPTDGAFNSKVEGCNLNKNSVTSDIIKQTIEDIKKDKIVTSNTVQNYTEKDYIEYKTKENFFRQHYKVVMKCFPEFKGVGFDVFCDILKKNNIQDNKIHYNVIYDLDLYKKDNLGVCAINEMNINQCERESFTGHKSEANKSLDGGVSYTKQNNNAKSFQL